MFFNSKNSSGWFITVLKVRRKANKIGKNAAKSFEDVDVNSNDVSTALPAYTEEQAKNDCIFLRTAIVNPTMRPMIEEKLKATAEYRKKICMDPANSLLERFPFFYTHPELVQACVI